MLLVASPDAVQSMDHASCRECQTRFDIFCCKVLTAFRRLIYDADSLNHDYVVMTTELLQSRFGVFWPVYLSKMSRCHLLFLFPLPRLCFDIVLALTIIITCSLLHSKTCTLFSGNILAAHSLFLQFLHCIPFSLDSIVLQPSSFNSAPFSSFSSHHYFSHVFSLNSRSP